MNPPIERPDSAMRAWLEAGPDRGRPEALERALAATRRVPQRPSWTFPERWLPMQLTLTRADVPRPVLYLVLAALLAAAIVLSVLAIGSRKSIPSFGPAGNGEIAYSSSFQIWVASADGSAARSLTEEGAMAFGPAFSADGSRLAYFHRAGAGSPFELIVSRSDGSQPRDVLAGSGIRVLSYVDAPAWSPDGSVLAFVGKADGEYRLTLASADRVELKIVATSTDALTHAGFSPAGGLLAVRRTDDKEVALVVMRPDGTDQRRVGGTTRYIDDNGVDQSFADGRGLFDWYAWSPGGDRIAYDEDGDIFVVHLPTGTTTKIGLPDVHEFNPTFSPDGNLIAFFGNEGTSVDVAALDGTRRRTVATDALCAPGPLAFSPDGKVILGAAKGSTCVADRPGRLAGLVLATGEIIDYGIASESLPSWQRVLR